MNAEARRMFGEMLAELESNRLTVVLVPQKRFTNSGGCIRVAVTVNAPWYRELCAGYASMRRRKNAAFDTRVKRENIARVLRRLIEAGESRSGYVSHLLHLARKRWRAQHKPAADRRAMTMRLVALSGGLTA